MKLKSKLGAVQAAVILYIVAGAALTQLVPNWRITKLFQRGPRTEQLQAAQDAAKKAEEELARLRAERAAFEQEKANKKDEQVSSGQEYVHATGEALRRVKNPGPEVAAAKLLNGRAEMSLALAMGRLPAAQQAEMIKLVDGLLSDHKNELDAAMKKIEERDEQIKIVTAERIAVEKKLAVVEARIPAAEEKVHDLSGRLEEATNAVKVWAEKKVESDRESGSLQTLITRFLIGFAAGYVFLHFILPSLAAQFPGSRLLSKFYQAATSIASAHEIPKSTDTTPTTKQ